MATISILPLPEEDGFIKGYYGLEACFFRGIVRVHFPNIISIKSLSISVQGTMTTTFADQEISSTVRTKCLFKNQVTLLEDIVLEQLKFIDVPFEIQIPLHEPVSNGFGPCSELLLPCMNIFGGDYYKRYNGQVNYSIESILTQNTSIPFYFAIEKASVRVPLKVFDPRLICGMLHPEQRKWKSHVGQVPLEYDVFINSSVYGPGDTLELSYTLLVNDIYAHRGVRVRKVSLSIKEIHTVGEGRCCYRDDDHGIWYHGFPVRVRGSKEVLQWSSVEYPPADDPYPRGRVRTPYKCEKYQGLATNPQFSTSDGIFVQRTVGIPIPKLTIAPSTGRIIIPPNDRICKHMNPRDAFIQIRHLLQVSIELTNGEKITVDAGVYMASISKQQCLLLLQKEGEIVPTLDYEKLIGLEVWVPEYTKKDPLGIELDPEILKETLGINIDQDSITSSSSESTADSPTLLPAQCIDPQSIPSSPPPVYQASLVPYQSNIDYISLPLQQRPLDVENLVNEAMNDSLV